jgi:hypothetical protein
VCVCTNLVRSYTIQWRRIEKQTIKLYTERQKGVSNYLVFLCNFMVGKDGRLLTRRPNSHDAIGSIRLNTASDFEKRTPVF